MQTGRYTEEDKVMEAVRKERFLNRWKKYFGAAELPILRPPDEQVCLHDREHGREFSRHEILERRPEAHRVEAGALPTKERSDILQSGPRFRRSVKERCPWPSRRRVQSVS